MPSDERSMDVSDNTKCKTESHTKIEHTPHGVVKTTVTTKRDSK